MVHRGIAKFRYKKAKQKRGGSRGKNAEKGNLVLSLCVYGEVGVRVARPYSPGRAYEGCVKSAPGERFMWLTRSKVPAK